MTTVLSRRHPALVAATRLGLPLRKPTEVHVLEETQKSAVYRLVDRTGSRAVVKRCAPGTGAIERLVYESVLPQLSLRGLEYFGSHEGGDGVVWLGLEDAGDAEPRLETPGVRASLTEWIAVLHREGARLGGGRLPDRGPAHFAQRLQESRDHLVSRLETGRNSSEDGAILERAIDRCDRLAAVWPRIEGICARFPDTVVHGDVAAENLRVVGVGSTRRLVPLDWEKSGWGVPAVDLVTADPGVYWQLTGGWLRTSREAFDELVSVGRIFGVLLHQWAAKSIGKAERTEARLGKLLARSGWETCG